MVLGGGPQTATVHLAGSAIFNAGSSFQTGLNGMMNFDQLQAGGQVALLGGPKLNVTLGYEPQIGDSFPILHGDGGLTGIFNGLPNGAGLTLGNFRFQISYAAGSVVLTRVFGPATQYLVGVPNHIQAGTAFDVLVIAQDPDGNAVDTYAGTVQFSTSDPTGGSLPADYRFTQADQGVHLFAGGATFYSAGSQTITVRDAVTGVSSSATVAVNPAPAVAFVLAAPLHASAGLPFNVTVTALDPYGNIDTNYQGTVHFSTSDTDPGVQLPADYTFQDSGQGVHTFPGGVTLVTPGDQILTVTDPASGITGSAAITVAPGGNASPPRRASGGDGLSRTPVIVAAIPANGLRMVQPVSADSVDLLFASFEKKQTRSCLYLFRPDGLGDSNGLELFSGVV